MNQKNKIIGTFLRQHREAKALTQKQLASEFNLGSTQFVSNWERGICLPPPNYLPKLCQILSIDKKVLIHLILDKTEADLNSFFSNCHHKETKNGTK